MSRGPWKVDVLHGSCRGGCTPVGCVNVGPCVDMLWVASDSQGVAGSRNAWRQYARGFVEVSDPSAGARGHGAGCDAAWHMWTRALHVGAINERAMKGRPECATKGQPERVGTHRGTCRRARGRCR